MTPMSNALGYAESKRTEEVLDPNRDFPFLIEDGSKCMTTIVGRVINEIFREYLVQIAMTFHGGMRAISYEWGGPNHPVPNDFSPDHIAQKELVQQMQVLGGHLTANKNGKWFYPVGTLNKEVYPVKGGMEDWAYVGSWDTKNVRPCQPKTYQKDGIPPYPKEKTIYNNAQLRSFNILLESSDLHTPKDGWGAVQDLQTPDLWDDIWKIDDSHFDGHIPRNMRIAMFVINSVQTYVVIQKWPKTIQFDMEKNKVIGDLEQVLIGWMVSGAISVYDYDVMFAVNGKEDSQQSLNWKILEMWKEPNWRMTLDLKTTTDALTEKEWKFGMESQTKLTVNMMRQITTECIASNAMDTINGKKHCSIWMNVRVKVDDQWMDNRDLKTGEIVKTYPKGIGPQSHVVNARNMDAKDWNMQNNKYFVKASEWWMAEYPVQIDVYFQGDSLNERVTTTKPWPSSVGIGDHGFDDYIVLEYGSSWRLLKIAAPMCVMALIAFLCLMMRNGGRTRRHEKRTYQRVPTTSVMNVM